MPTRLLALLAGLAVLLGGCSAADLSSAISPSPPPAAGPSPIVLGRATPAGPTPIVLGRATPVASPAATRPAAGQPQWGQRAKTSGCAVDGPLPDSACTPGDVFPQ